jgi:hypothetical protein
MESLPEVIRFGTGRAARVAAMTRADAMREQGVAARALFKVEFGGWVVAVSGRIRRKRTADEARAAVRGERHPDPAVPAAPERPIRCDRARPATR